jgi:hypothetical protein
MNDYFFFICSTLKKNNMPGQLFPAKKDNDESYLRPGNDSRFYHIATDKTQSKPLTLSQVIHTSNYWELRAELIAELEQNTTVRRSGRRNVNVTRQRDASVCTPSQ